MKQIPQNFISVTKELLDKSTSIVILAHKNPDGDALGSGLALLNYLHENNKNATFILPNDLPKSLSWMPNVDQALTYTGSKKQVINKINSADLIFMLDFNHESRLDNLASLVLEKSCSKLMIDHHPYPQEIADYKYSRVSASSTAEMVFELLSSLENDKTLSKQVAECLYVGLMTDTGNLSYNSSNPLTFMVVGDLLKSGIDKDEMTDKIYNNYSEYRLRLLGHSVNSKMKVIPELQTAYIYLSRTDLDEYNFEQGDTEGFVNYPLSIKGIVFSAIFIEKDGYTKCSFRSKGSFPANKVAGEYFKGGGHMNAAGGEFKGSLSSATQKFEEVLPEFKHHLND